ncbi:MAG: lipid II flippase MurJ, partial [Stellaceae bacterium]
MLLAVAVQAAGFVRMMIIAAEFGASLDVDAYNLGIVVPTFISTVIGGWLQVGFVGRYAGLVATDDHDTAAAYRSRMLLLVTLLAATVTALCILLPDRIMMLFLPSSKEVTASAAAAALSVTGWILGPTIIGDFLGLVLNSHGRFFAAASAPLANAAISVAALLLWPAVGLPALVWSLVLGSISQFAVVAAALASVRLSFPVRSLEARGEVLTTIAIGLPLLPAMMLANSASAILQFRSAELGEGAVAILGYATRLHNALTQVVV